MFSWANFRARLPERTMNEWWVNSVYHVGSRDSGDNNADSGESGGQWVVTEVTVQW
jgi:hypothetical protein